MTRVIALVTVVLAMGLHTATMAKAAMVRNFLLTGVTWYDFDEELGDRLNDLGLADPDNVAIMGGGGFGWRYKRLMHDVQIFGTFWDPVYRNNTRTTVGGFSALTTLAYNVLPEGPLLVYPAVGIGFSKFWVVVRVPDEIDFADAAAEPPIPREFGNKAVIVTTGGGLDWLVDIRDTQLVLTVRGGYRFDITETDEWRIQGSEVKNAPEASHAGPYIRLSVGMEMAAKK